MAQCVAWTVVDCIEEARHLCWKRVAYATRYGKGVGLREALQMDQQHLNGFLEALSALVEEENRASK